jgi:hypothetical protein
MTGSSAAIDESPGAIATCSMCRSRMQRCRAYHTQVRLPQEARQPRLERAELSYRIPATLEQLRRSCSKWCTAGRLPISLIWDNAGPLPLSRPCSCRIATEGLWRQDGGRLAHGHWRLCASNLGPTASATASKSPISQTWWRASRRGRMVASLIALIRAMWGRGDRTGPRKHPCGHLRPVPSCQRWYAMVR